MSLHRNYHAPWTTLSERIQIGHKSVFKVCEIWDKKWKTHRFISSQWKDPQNENQRWWKVQSPVCKYWQTKKCKYNNHAKYAQWWCQDKWKALTYLSLYSDMTLYFANYDFLSVLDCLVHIALINLILSYLSASR